ncbi:50S ribosomal protein L9 [Phototrophicus methaneseepsis]|uniref:Large ribosomal subunit protein bL9 n=1 Tax=Phototrophicus methaneseepsis TaxID=2710758 RepID=A0A7S8E876_9CHLR|nr:50S ribosomal protein L9 [Phototrophicus methaneseepsis]QPC82161.1 50S ribosomal protein L9 [Phototrophicus methaneseepsis]
MKVILLQDIYKHGVAGEVVDVANGFARNFLIPRKMAVQATKNALRAHKKLTERVEARRAQYENMLNEVAQQINGAELIFERRAASTGKLFGSVTNQEMADELLNVTGIDINRRRISQQNLRELGTHEVPVRIGTEETPVITVVIVREGELQEFLAAREAGEATEYDQVVEAEETVEVEEVVEEPVAEAAGEAEGEE